MSAIENLRARFGLSPSPKGLPDYSPSLMKYRMERIWLTPFYKFLVRTGLPLAVVLAVAWSYFSKEENRVQLVQSIHSARTMIEDRPEFSIRLVEIRGSSAIVSEQVREALPMEFPISSLRLNLKALRERIESVDAVKRADVYLRDGVLEIQIDERKPALIWRGQSHLELVDAIGERAGVLSSRKGYYDIPLITGTGAQDHVNEALAIWAASKPIVNRVRGLRRMGERRWDLVLDRQQIIQLPVQDPVIALERVIALHAARDVLGRDVSVVDMRDVRRPILRLSVPAMEQLYRLRAIADWEDKT